METTPISVSDAIALINQTLDYAYPTLIVEGEIASFKVNQGKFVFFDLKDDTGTLGCFMMLFQLRMPVEDGMRVRVVVTPKITQWGKFSLTVREIRLVGEGTLKRAFDLLYTKLEKEGLFLPERKRALPEIPQRIGVVSSTAAAGYKDFIAILQARWAGLDIVVVPTQVQGSDAPQQMVSALQQLNALADVPDVIAIVRGGGSADDLSAFNDEPLVRAIAASRVPTIVGVGHETDTSLADLVADVSALTPTNAAQLLVPDKLDYEKHLTRDVDSMAETLKGLLYDMKLQVTQSVQFMIGAVQTRHNLLSRRHSELEALLAQLNPLDVLRRGYSVLRDEQGRVTSHPKVGDAVSVETKDSIIKAGVTHVQTK